MIARIVTIPREWCHENYIEIARRLGAEKSKSKSDGRVSIVSKVSAENELIKRAALIPTV
jgi:hypothetical protein